VDNIANKISTLVSLIKPHTSAISSLDTLGHASIALPIKAVQLLDSRIDVLHTAQVTVKTAKFKVQRLQHSVMKDYISNTSESPNIKQCPQTDKILITD
jgi:hypothetical protein